MTVLLSTLAFSSWCLFAPPVDGPIVRPFAPQGAFGGHWGIDLAVPVGTPVRSIAPGVVTFSGEVALRPSVTVDHGGGIRSSYSYLDTRVAAVGQRVSAGTALGTSGVDHGVPALHLSIRIGARYVDPASLCALRRPGHGLRLVA